MYRTLIAEDEPAAMRYLRTLVETRFPEFSVVATASNGREALEYAQAQPLDLVITDVKMPVIDGLELVVQLRESHPKLPVVIVSGHEDFEFVRRALNTGVVDYVLKPVTSRRLSEVFHRLSELLRENADGRELQGFKQLVGGETTGDMDEVIRIALLRYGAPPSRFARQTVIRPTEQCKDGFCTTSGRDEHETLLLAHASRIDLPDFVTRCRSAIDPDRRGYHTMVVDAEGVPASRLAAAVESFYQGLDRRIILGQNQLLKSPFDNQPVHSPHRVLSGLIEEAVINSDVGALEALIVEELAKWERASLPILALHASARKLIEAVQQKAVRLSDEPGFDPALEQLLVRARSYRELESALSRLALEIAGLEERGDRAADTASIFTAIKSHLEATYARPHTVESIRTQFRISASYLNKLFRANTGSSFNEYLTQLRVDAAKRLLLESPETPIKNIARYVGYRDPFYFSRVFRNTTGESPSEFLRARQ